MSHALPTPGLLPAIPSLRRRSLLALGLGLGLGLLPACALDPDEDHHGGDAPDTQPLRKSPRTAWVFSSGGPRGFVHVGVIKALDELGLVPDLIVGASVGAAVGILRAAGRKGLQIEALALDLQPVLLTRLTLGGSGRFSGSAVADWLRAQTGHRLLEQLAIPAVCVVQRLADAAVLGWNRGDLGLAVQAACAIEGQFAPVRVRGQRFADADGVAPLPVRLARALGASRVLAVDASAHEDRAPPGTERWRAGDLRKRMLTRPDAALADLVLQPEFGYYASISREYRARAIAAGYRDVMAAAAAIRALHAA